jgi:hypothetical protein
VGVNVGADVGTLVSVAEGGVDVGITTVGWDVLVGITAEGVVLRRLHAVNSHTNAIAQEITALRDIRYSFHYKRGLDR